MSWSDLIWSGNPNKRERLIRKSQELLELMKRNFRATNQLIQVLKKHLGLSFRPVTLNQKATVKENCDVMIERIHEIQAEVEKIDQQMKEKLEPALYEKLKKQKSLSIPDFQQVSKVVCVVCGIAALVSTVVLVGWLLQNLNMFTTIVMSFGYIGIGIMGTVVFGVLYMGFGVIFGIIIGGTECYQLERALKDYDEALEKFGPASDEYQDSINYVKIRLEMNK